MELVSIFQQTHEEMLQRKLVDFNINPILLLCLIVALIITANLSNYKFEGAFSPAGD